LICGVVIHQIEQMRRIRAAGKAPGILVTDELLVRRCIDAGSLFTAVGVDTVLLARSADALARKFDRGGR